MTIPILTRAGDLLARYEVLISDVWGVVHDGLLALPPACETLERYREAGGQVTTLAGEPFTLDKTEILSSNGAIHQLMIEAIAQADSA